jgi:hypothetical protein
MSEQLTRTQTEACKKIFVSNNASIKLGVDFVSLFYLEYGGARGVPAANSCFEQRFDQARSGFCLSFLTLIWGSADER